MSACHPNIARLIRPKKSSSPSKKSSSESEGPSSSSLVSLEDAPRRRRAPETRRFGIQPVRAVLALPNNSYTQIPMPTRQSRIHNDPESRSDIFDPEYTDIDDFAIRIHDSESPTKSSRNRAKRERQFNKWSTDVIPSLLPLYLALLR